MSVRRPGATVVTHARPGTGQVGHTGAHGLPDGWTRGSHTHDGVTHATYRRGSGPGVIVIHEIPGITPEVATFAEEVVDAGFTVVMPSLFGTDGAPVTARTVASSIGRCA